MEIVPVVVVPEEPVLDHHPVFFGVDDHARVDGRLESVFGGEPALVGLIRAAGSTRVAREIEVGVRTEGGELLRSHARRDLGPGVGVAENHLIVAEHKFNGQGKVGFTAVGCGSAVADLRARIDNRRIQIDQLLLGRYASLLTRGRSGTERLSEPCEDHDEQEE